MPKEELLHLSAHSLNAGMAQGRWSSEEIVRAHLDCVEEVNDRLHAIVQISKTALDEARHADKERANGRASGALHGVPVTIKDWLDTKDIISSAGYEHRKGFLPKEDATVVRRLREAGAIILGKTKAGVAEDEYPVPRNPFDLTRTPGASSAGEAALLAAAGSSLGIGSDSGGSLRWPAHCCGVSAFKPSSGVVPLTGHYPPIAPLADPRTVIGPMARHVADLALVMEIIGGPDGKDPSALPLKTQSPLGQSLEGLRIGWFDRIGDIRCDDDTSAALSQTCSFLRGTGTIINEVEVPGIEEAMAITQSYWARPESGSLTSWRPWGKSHLSADEVEKSIFEWDRFRRTTLAFMADYDLLICPVAVTPAPARLDVTSEDYLFTVPFSLTGQPVLSMRAGTSEGGLPIGLQLVGRAFEDHMPLAVGLGLEVAYMNTLGDWPRPVLEQF